jgi:hypothetical protein
MSEFYRMAPFARIEHFGKRYELYGAGADLLLQFEAERFSSRDSARYFITPPGLTNERSLYELRDFLAHDGFFNLNRCSYSGILDIAADRIASKRIIVRDASFDRTWDALRKKWYPKAATQQVPLSNQNVLEWLCRATKSSEGNFLDPYSYLNVARNKLGLDKNDSNLTAAERYMEGYEGNYSDHFMLGQHILKQLRKVPGADRILKRNGSPAEHSAFVTKWGMTGNFHRSQGTPIGGYNGACKILADLKNQQRK